MLILWYYKHKELQAGVTAAATSSAGSSRAEPWTAWSGKEQQNLLNT
jgi:hypothetical protein